MAALQREWPTQVPAEPDSERFEDLVSRGEAVLSTALGGWVRQMNEALRELQARQADAARQVEPGLPTQASGHRGRAGASPGLSAPPQAGSLRKELLPIGVIQDAGSLGRRL